MSDKNKTTASPFLTVSLPTQVIAQALYRDFLTTFIIKDKATDRAIQMVRIMGINPEQNALEAIYYTLEGDEKFLDVFTEDPAGNGVMNVPKMTVMNLLANMYDDEGLRHYAIRSCALYERMNKGDGVKQFFAPRAHNDRRVIPTPKVNEEALQHMQDVSSYQQAVSNGNFTGTLDEYLEQKARQQVLRDQHSPRQVQGSLMGIEQCREPQHGTQDADPSMGYTFDPTLLYGSGGTKPAEPDGSTPPIGSNSGSNGMYL